MVSARRCVLTKFSPTAQPLVQADIGGIQVGQLGSLAIDPANGALWHPAQDGTIRVFDPNTLAATPRLKVKVTIVARAGLSRNTTVATVLLRR
jgi:hypothetical protein